MDDRVVEALAAGGDPEAARHRLDAVVAADPALADDPERLFRAALVCVASRALASALAQHTSLLDGEVPESASVPLRLRAELIPILAHDLAGVVAAARQALLPRQPILAETSCAVLAMGKWGARELNDFSDLAPGFVHAAPAGSSDPARSAAIALASRVVTTLSSPTFEGTAC